MTRGSDVQLVRRRRDREMLGVALFTIVASLLLQVRADDRVAPRFFASLPLPPTCMSQECFGVPCPGCGLTRSFIDLSRGDWDAAWSHHRLGWLLAVAVVFQIPYRIVALRRPKKPILSARLRSACVIGLIGALIGNWLLLISGH